MRLIDADQMLADDAEAFANVQARVDDTATWLVNDVVHKKFQMLVNDTPTVEAVPVVRCKECEMAVESGSNYLICTGWGCPTDFDGFCHMGERKDNHEID